jgi:outer membrane protein, heavy metal efflux system
MHRTSTLITVFLLTVPLRGEAQLTLTGARQQAIRASPEIVAAREAVNVARAHERQAAAFLNPVLSYGREQTSNAAQSNAQDVIAAEQSFEWPGVRTARKDAARIRREAAEARLAVAEAQLSFDVARAWANAFAADRRASLADTIARAFDAASAIAEHRFREGDISGFAVRRVRLESARYASLRAEAMLGQHLSRVTLATLLADSARRDQTAASLPVLPTALPSDDSLVTLALRSRRDLDAFTLELAAARADARLAARGRMPTIALTAGTKSEDIGVGDRLSGFVAGVAVPLPLWDRRAGAVGAAEAESRRRDAETIVMRRRVSREVAEAAAAFRAVHEHLASIGPSVQADAAAALRSAQTAYAEGEITLLEWLDTVRAYHETEAAIANLQAEAVTRAAALERAVGVTLFGELR